MKKFLTWVCLFAMLLTMFSCAKDPVDNVDGKDTTADADGETVDTAPEEGGLKVFKKSDIANFKIAYYSDLSDEVVAAVNELADQINSICGSSIKVTSDFILSSDKYMKEWDHEILIGLTNREQSSAFAQDMRINDYGYGYIDGKILICGKNDKAIKNAINSFVLNVLIAHANDDLFYQSDWSLIERYAYAVESLTVNGSSVHEYEIIYPKNGTLFEKQMAMRLQSYILDKTGYELMIKDDSEARKSDKAFLIGKTQHSTELVSGTLSAGQGCVNSTGGDIVAWGNDMTGTVNACKKLTELLISTEINAFEQTVTFNSAVTASVSSNFSTMSFNVYTADQTEARIERVINVLLRYMPDSIGLQEADEKWMMELKKVLPDYYEFVGEGREGGSKGDAVPILYSKEKYNLIESGTKWLTSTPDQVSKMPGSDYYRNFTWALLEDKATGVRYLHVNTHLDTAGSEIRLAEVKILMQFLQNYNDVPVVLTGDMNAKLNTEELNYFTNAKLATVFDYKDLTGVKSNANAIDWIYLTSDSIKMTYHTFDDSTYNGDRPSDHDPHYAEFSVSKFGEGELDHGWDLGFSDYPDTWVTVSKDTNGGDYKEIVHVVDPTEHVVIGSDVKEIKLNGVTYVVIRSVEQLNAANQQVTNNPSLAYNYILANDLDYTGKAFQRIKLSPSIFNGNGYTIHGLNLTEVNAGGSDGLSIFVSSNGDIPNTVLNLTVGTPDQPAIITSDRVGGTVGAIFPYANSRFLLENITVYANITTTNANVGGLLGFIRGSLKMSNCRFYGSVFDTSGRPSGGLAGAVECDAVLTDCVNYGNVTSVANAGGIAATVNATGTYSFTNCVNYGTVTGVTAGGLVGGLNIPGSATFDKCLNVGTVIGTATNTGGLIGWFNCTEGAIFKNCANIASVAGSLHAAGLICHIEDGSKWTLENCGSFGSLIPGGDNKPATVVADMGCAPQSVTNLFVLSVENDATDAAVTKTTKTKPEALAWVNELFADDLGIFVMNSDDNAMVKVQPNLVAIQEAAAASKAGNIRLVAQLSDCLRYSKVGFEITVDSGTLTKHETTTVLRKLLYSTEKGTKEITALMLGGTYLYAVEVEDMIPAEGTVTVTVTPYATEAEGETLYRGTSYVLTYTNGVLVSVVESQA